MQERRGRPKSQERLDQERRLEEVGITEPTEINETDLKNDQELAEVDEILGANGGSFYGILYRYIPGQSAVAAGRYIRKVNIPITHEEIKEIAGGGRFILWIYAEPTHPGEKRRKVRVVNIEIEGQPKYEEGPPAPAPFTQAPQPENRPAPADQTAALIRIAEQNFDHTTAAIAGAQAQTIATMSEAFRAIERERQKSPWNEILKALPVLLPAAAQLLKAIQPAPSQQETETRPAGIIELIREFKGPILDLASAFILPTSPAPAPSDPAGAQAISQPAGQGAEPSRCTDAGAEAPPREETVKREKFTP